MAALTLPVGSVLYFDTGTDAATPTWTKISEHNRGPISLELMRIEKTQRMSNGSLRKIHIADKKEISTSWSALPTYDSFTVDGGYGAADIRAFYLDKGKGTFKVKISYNAIREEILTASFTSCTFSISKRNVKVGGIIKKSEVTATSYAASVTTFTGPNVFVAGDKVVVSNAAPAEYNGVFTIATATSTSFTIAGAKAAVPTTSKALVVTAGPDPQEFWDVSLSLEEV